MKIPAISIRTGEIYAITARVPLADLPGKESIAVNPMG